MSQGGVDIERQYLVRAADGTAYWDGLLRAGEIMEVINNEASLTLGFGEACREDAGSTGSTWPRWDLAASSEPVKKEERVLRISAATNVFLRGVAIENIPSKQQGRVAGTGSLVAVKCINPPTSNIVGSAITGSATAGSVDTVLNGPAAAGICLGLVAKPSGVGAGQIGSTTQLGAFVSPF